MGGQLRLDPVPKGLGSQLRAGVDTKFGEDMGQVSLDAGQGDEQPRRGLRIGQVFGDQGDRFQLARGETGPAGGGALARAAASRGICDRFVSRQLGALSPGGLELSLAEALLGLRERSIMLVAVDRKSIAERRPRPARSGRASIWRRASTILPDRPPPQNPALQTRSR